jgi:cytochrome c556
MRHLIVVTIALLAASIAAADTPEDSLKYRKAVMDTMAGHITALSLIFNGKVEHQEYLLTHAEALAGSAEQVGKIFPAGSAVGKSEALPLIWQEPEKFQKAAEAVKVATAQLRDAVKGGDKAAIGKAIKPVGDACKACHDRYRKEED